MARFSIAQAIEAGWDTAKNNFVLLLGGLVVMLLAGAAPMAIMTIITNVTGAESFVSGLFMSVGSLAQFIITSALGLGLVKMTLKLADKEPVEFSEMFNHFSLVFNMLVAQLLAYIAVVIGLCLLVVPGIIIMIKLQFFAYFIVQEGCGPIESLQKSWEMTKGVKFQLFLFDMVLYLMNILGMLCFGVGIFVTGVISLAAAAYVFRKLEGTAPTAEVASPIR